jgi:hypothetical protein
LIFLNGTDFFDFLNFFFLNFCSFLGFFQTMFASVVDQPQGDTGAAEAGAGEAVGGGEVAAGDAAWPEAVVEAPPPEMK